MCRSLWLKAELRVGSTVAFEVLSSETKLMKLKAKITKLDEAAELNWAGGSVIAISGMHYFRIKKLGNNSVRFHHGEVFKGLLLPLLKKMLKNSELLYRNMNRAVKNRVEK
ncbi:MAG TPA: hypothetical protein ENI05_00925 [Porticoccus sp.]|nr:hypothetical protein [Porticoccus sp.]